MRNAQSFSREQFYHDQYTVDMEVPLDWLPRAVTSGNTPIASGLTRYPKKKQIRTMEYFKCSITISMRRNR